VRFKNNLGLHLQHDGVQISLDSTRKNAFSNFLDSDLASIMSPLKRVEETQNAYMPVDMKTALTLFWNLKRL